MSRTDKDAPYWVRAQYYEPRHAYCQFDQQNWGWRHFPDGPRECDLPVNPTYRKPERRRWSQRESWTCHWESGWPWRSRHLDNWGPRPIDRRLLYWKPDRARVRAACDRARKEHNTFGQTEVEVPQFQHRHAETIGGGWWS